MSKTLRFAVPHDAAALATALAALPELAPGPGDDCFPFSVSSDGETLEVVLHDYAPVDDAAIVSLVEGQAPIGPAAEPGAPLSGREADLATVRARASRDPDFAALLRLAVPGEPEAPVEPELAIGVSGATRTVAAVPLSRGDILRERLTRRPPGPPPSDNGYRCRACAGATPGTPGGLALPEVLSEPLPPLAVWQGLILIDAEPGQLDGYAAALDAIPEWQRGLVTGVRLGPNPGDYDPASGILTLPRRTAATVRPPELVLHHLFGHAVGEAAGADMLGRFAATFWVGDIPLEHPDPLGAAGGDPPGAIRRDFAESYRLALAGEDSPRAAWMRRRVFKEE